MVFLIIFAVFFLFFLGLTGYFFVVAFVKLNVGDLENINDIANKPLWDHKEEIATGIEYIKGREFKWVSTLSFDGLTLKARYFDNGFDNVIILFHGYRSAAARDFSCAVKMYTKLGFNVLLVDQRSHGQSEGKLITFGIKESKDVISWIQFAENNFNTQKIALSGMSMGATTVLLSCEHNLSPIVKCIIADSGFTSPVDIIKKVARQALKINASVFIPILNLYCLLFGKFSLYSMNTVESIKKSSVPILFIHGNSDNFVPCEMSEINYQAIKNRAELLLVENADHGLGFLVDTEKVYKTLENFLKTNC